MSEVTSRRSTFLLSLLLHLALALAPAVSLTLRGNPLPPVVEVEALWAAPAPTAPEEATVREVTTPALGEPVKTPAPPAEQPPQALVETAKEPVEASETRLKPVERPASTPPTPPAAPSEPPAKPQVAAKPLPPAPEPPAAPATAAKATPPMPTSPAPARTGPAATTVPPTKVAPAPAPTAPPVTPVAPEVVTAPSGAWVVPALQRAATQTPAATTTATATPAAPSPPAGAAEIEADSTTTPPAYTPARLTRRIEPRYPTAARKAGQAGTVHLILQVGVKGRVERVEVADSSGFPSLDEAAVRAAKTWRYEPAYEDGRPVASAKRVAVVFRLED